MKIINGLLGCSRASQVALVVKNLLPMQETEEPWVPSLSWEEPLEEAMAAHSSVPAWRSPRTEEPSRLQSIGSKGWTPLKQLKTHTGCSNSTICRKMGGGSGFVPL